MKKEKHSCIHANYPETKMKCVVCYDGEVVLHAHKVSKRKRLVAISVKGGPHKISNVNELAVTVLHGKGAYQVKGRKKVRYDGEGSFDVPANAWVEITSEPFAQFYADEYVNPVLGDDDDNNCELC